MQAIGDMAGTAAALQWGEIVRIRDERWRIVRRVNADRVTLVEAAGCDTANRASRATFLLPFEAVDRFDLHAAPRVVGRRRWQRAARRALAEAFPSWASLRVAAGANLRILPFQLEPVLALVRGEGCRFLIADAVGLGKTVQAGLMIAETLARRPGARTLVISPAALREQWRQELQGRFCISADVFDAAGVARLSSELPPEINPWSVRRIIITSIDYVKRPEVVRSLESLTWDLVAFDEAHNLTGRSDRSSAARAIGSRARALVLLTATPHSGDEQAFARLCKVGALNRSDSLLVFRRTRMDVGLPRARRDTLLRVRPTVAELAMYDTLMTYARLVWRWSNQPGRSSAQLAMSVLSRRACSSASSLARSVERRLNLLGGVVPEPIVQIGLPFMDAVVGDEEPWMSLGSPGLPNAHEECGHLARLLDLARSAAMAESKLAALRRLILRAAEPAIVFTEYRDTLRELAVALTDVDTAQLHGGLSTRERADALARFAEGDAHVLLATDAASEGLNLHHRCRLVINLELPWTPTRLEQRAGRVDRIGQSRRAHIVHFVAKGTCEELTLAKLARRICRMEGAMGLTGPGPDERHVAESVLGDRPIPEMKAAPPRESADLSRVDLRQEARVEAHRIAFARTLFDHGPPPAEGPGVMTLLSRRRGARPKRRCWWVFRITVSDSSGQVVWEPLVALAADVSHGHGRRHRDIRRLLAPDHPSIAKALRAVQDHTLFELRETLRRPVARWASRERALMARVRDCRARLSAGLLQRSLFDRRNERLAASQTAVLDEALAQAVCRLRELDALDALEVDSCSLVFAAVVE